MKRQKKMRDISITLVILQLSIVLVCLWIIILKDNLLVERYLGYQIPHIQNIEVIVLITTLSLSTIIIYFLLHYFRTSHLEQEFMQEKLQNEMAQNAIHLLRCHRHDFLNHLQVILGHIQLNKLPQAESYIMNIHEEIRGIRMDNDAQLPEVAVLLYTKREEASRKNITLNFDFGSNLSKLSIKEPDLVRILSNLIDNALYELKQLPDSVEKIVEVSFEEHEGRYFIEVFNTGSFIENTERVFDYGYTTKGRLGSGIGLYNVKQLVEKYNGKITVESDRESGTTFAITF